MISVLEKTCSVCKKILPATTQYFNKKERGINGLCSWCKKCHSAKTKKAARAWSLRNPEKHASMTAEYKRTPKGKLTVAAHAHHRRALIKESGGVFTANDIVLQLKTQKGLCWWCGKRLNGKYEVDHRFPISRGGTNSPNNIVCACKKCNRAKTNKLPHEWNGRLI